MAKIPTILEAGRADGKLITSDNIFDKNKSIFQSELNDIQDTLNSDNPNKPLSAKQGKILKALLDSKIIEAGSVPIDTKPIEGNITHLVNSDGLAKEFNKYNTEIILGGVYDVSAHNNSAVFESLSTLLSSSNLDTLIPTSVRHGGMSIRFIQSSDNKYVQYRLMSDTFNATESNWQGVDNEIADNNNIISNAGVYGLKDKLLIGTQSKTITDEAFVNNGNMYNKGNINSSNTDYRNTDLIPVKTGDVVTIDYTLYTESEAICLYGLDVIGYLAKTYNTGQAIPKITVTQDGYVRFCKKAIDTDGSAIHIYHNGGELNEINEKLDELTYTDDANIQLKEDDFKYVGSLLPNGAIYTSNTNCICTDLIEVGQNKNIVTNLYIGYGGRIWVQYAEDGVTAVADSGNVISASLRTFTMNKAAKYIRFCWEYKGDIKKPFPFVKYEGSVVSEINNIKNHIATLETKHNIEYYSKDFELEDRGDGYINGNTGAAEFNKTGYASPWIPLRKGIYKIKTESNCYVNVYKHVLYSKDYATNDKINSVTTKANVESILLLSEAGFMRVTPVNSVTTGAEGIHIEQFGELEGDMPILPTWDKLHISGFDNKNIRLYIPMGSGVFEIVNLKHYTSNNYVEYIMDHWGIDTCYLSTNANEKAIGLDYPITRASEYEQAIDIVSDTHNGYIGGHMHGYEQMDSIQIKVDGVTRDDYHFSDDCEQVEIIQYSTLYETDKSTEIAKVTKRWVFDNKKFDTFINTIFSKRVTINHCMTAMFGILRRLDPEKDGERGAYLTNKGMKDTSWQIVSTTDGWDNPSTYTDGAQMLKAGNNEATHLEQWGDLGYKTVLEVPKASRLTGAGMLINTNGGTYNKMYYDCGSGQMNIGDYIFSHAIFKFGRFLV